MERGDGSPTRPQASVLHGNLKPTQLRTRFRKADLQPRRDWLSRRTTDGERVRIENMFLTNSHTTGTEGASRDEQREVRTPTGAWWTLHLDSLQIHLVNARSPWAGTSRLRPFEPDAISVTYTFRLEEEPYLKFRLGRIRCQPCKKKAPSHKPYGTSSLSDLCSTNRLHEKPGPHTSTTSTRWTIRQTCPYAAWCYRKGRLKLSDKQPSGERYTTMGDQFGVGAKEWIRVRTLSEYEKICGAMNAFPERTYGRTAKVHLLPAIKTKARARITDPKRQYWVTGFIQQFKFDLLLITIDIAVLPFVGFSVKYLPLSQQNVSLRHAFFFESVKAGQVVLHRVLVHSMILLASATFIVKRASESHMRHHRRELKDSQTDSDSSGDLEVRAGVGEGLELWPAEQLYCLMLYEVASRCRRRVWDVGKGERQEPEVVLKQEDCGQDERSLYEF
ncbi:hypothetical protein BXZ70DRAFT_910818 [Cristinia sonorae]|uniref:Uncharacterized protein n=1 Tax=Cristinia sonorae TaxID=1940300 RepID=A0A8K0UGU6_9AGAR|nr:hypothetical protein BXZ70DRAFT_910818 [Cristinia sonorae]